LLSVIFSESRRPLFQVMLSNYAPRARFAAGNVLPERITRMARSERRRPSQAMRGSA
jgi:hypothetical protein